MGIGGGVWAFFSAFGRLRLLREISGTPTSKARSAAMGKCELKGLARPLGEALRAPFSGRPCVWNHWKVEERRSDSKGRQQWVLLSEGTSAAPFLVEDSSGSLQVLPQGAEVEAPWVFSWESGGGFLGMGAKAGPPGGGASAWLGGSKKRFSERRIDPGLGIYALGVLRATDGEPQLTQGRNGEEFFLALNSEEALRRRLFWSVWARLLGGPVLALGSAALAASVFFGI
jgi:hypothetical protein